jgi:hypothetical protein
MKPAGKYSGLKLQQPGKSHTSWMTWLIQFIVLYREEAGREHCIMVKATRFIHGLYMSSFE